MNHLSTPCRGPAWEQERWERIGLGIRLAYNPFRPEVVRYWVQLGPRLADAGVLDETTMLQRTLRLLLQVAHDEALPWFWRSVCLEHTARPLARLATLVRPLDPVRAEALHAFVQTAHEHLQSLPPAMRLRPPAC